MTVPVEAPAANAGPTRPLSLRLARLHLRLGAHELARAELEAAAGDATLDEDALLDLAEVRWRTGDLLGAGVAANAFIGAGRVDPVAFVIAAEAAGSAGHTLEARRLAASAMSARPGSLDPLFAGMPRGVFWPTDHTAPTEPAGAFFGAEALGGADQSGTGARPSPPDLEHPATPVSAEADGDPSAHDGAPGLWAEHEVGPSPDGPSRPTVALAAARASLDAGDQQTAAEHLAELLRARPDLAASVLGALDGDATGPSTGPSTPADEGEAR